MVYFTKKEKKLSKQSKERKCLSLLFPLMNDKLKINFEPQHWNEL